MSNEPRTTEQHIGNLHRKLTQLESMLTMSSKTGYSTSSRTDLMSQINEVQDELDKIEGRS